MIQNLCFVLLLSCFAVGLYAQQPADTSFIPRQSILSPKSPAHLPQGYFYYASQKEQFLKNADTIAAVDAMRMMAIAAFKLGDLSDSENQSVQALQLITPYQAQPELVVNRLLGIYNQLGRIYEAKDMYDRAENYYNNALKIAENVSDSITIINNRANVYREMELLELAAADYQWVIKTAKFKADTLALARTLNNYGDLLSAQNSPEALPTLMEGLHLRQLKSSKEGVFGSYRHLVFYHQLHNSTDVAKEYAQKCLNIAKELNSAAYLKEAYNLLVMLNTDEAVVGYKKITDSINDSDRATQNIYAAMRFDVEQEKVNRVRVESQLEKERSEKQLTLWIGALTVLVFILIILLILYRVKQIKQREVFTTERRISKKVHDEVANEVYQLMVKMQLKQHTSVDWLDDLESIYNRSRDISKEFNTIDTKLPFSEVLTDLLISYQTEDLRIINRNVSKHNWELLSKDKKIALYRVLQELFTNMKKHSQATLVAVSVTQKGKKTEIKYSDNGVGTVLKKQNGLQNAENRIFALNGSITFETEPNKGFQVKILI